MKKNVRKLAALLLTCILAVAALSACSNQSKDNTKTEESTGTANDSTSTDNSSTPDDSNSTDNEAALSGTITLSGSTSMEKLANAAAEAFMNKYPDTTVSPEFTGSSAGIEALLQGTVDIGNSSRELKDTEVSGGAVANVVAIDGIAVIVDKANTVTNLTKDQLIGIYTGTIKNWSELGGADQPIVVVGRESGSGTRGAFEELNGIQDKCVYANEINSTGGVMAKVASTPGAIGYVSLDVLDDTVTALNLEGVAPNVEDIKAGTYFLSRPFVMATKGEISAQNELVQAFLNYMLSDEGQELVQSIGLITVK